MQSKSISCWIVSLALLAALVGWGQASLDNLNARPGELYRYGRGLMERGYYDRALMEFERYLERFPGGEHYDEANLLRITCLQKLKREKELLEAIQTYQSKFPTSKHLEELNQIAAELLREEKKYAEASKILLELLNSKKQSTREYASYFLGQCAFFQGNIPEAMAYYSKLAALPFEVHYEYRPYAVRDYARLLSQNGQLAEAERLFLRLARGGANVPAPVRAQALLNYGVTCIHLQKKKQALAAFEEYLVTFNNGEEAQAARRYRILMTLELNDFQAVIEYTADWRNRYPENVDYEMDYAQGYALMKMKRFGEALPFFQRVESDTSVPDYWRQNSSYLFIYCLNMARHFSEVIEKSQLFLEKYPKSGNKGDVLLWRGMAFSELSQDAEAANAFSQAMAQVGENPEEMTRAAQFLTNSYVKQKKYGEAAGVMRRLSENRMVESPEKWLFLAAEYEYQAGNVTAAIEDNQKLVALYPETPTAYEARLRLGEWYIARQNYPQAIEMVQALIQRAKPEALADLNAKMVQIYYYLQNLEKAEHYAVLAMDCKNLQESKRLMILAMLANLGFAKKANKKVLQWIDPLLAVPDGTLSYVDAIFLSRCANLYLQEKRMMEAEKVLRRILSLPNVAGTEVAYDAVQRLSWQVLMASQRFQEAVELLKDARESFEKWPQKQEHLGLLRELISLEAESRLNLQEADKAAILAQKAYALEEGEKISAARALYVLAFVNLTYEKRFSAANEYATRGYILYENPVYSPRLMALSINAFLEGKQPERAREVYRELSGTYPEWVALHPEIKKKLE